MNVSIDIQNLLDNLETLRVQLITKTLKSKMEHPDVSIHDDCKIIAKLQDLIQDISSARLKYEASVGSGLNPKTVALRKAIELLATTAAGGSSEEADVVVSSERESRA